MSYEKPIPLVPGDDWNFQIQTLDQAGAPIDLSGYTILERRVDSGPISFDVGVVFSSGLATITADNLVTAPLEMGNVSTLTIKVQAPDTNQTTVIFKHIEGVPVVQAVQSSAYIIGTQGPVGINWRDDVNSGVWLTGTAYGIRDGVYLDGTSYRAIAAHTASATSQPGVGATWHNFWDVIALGANEAEVAIVAANIGSIVTVGNSIGAVNTVAGSIAAVNTVAGINVAVTNVAAIAAQIVTAASISAQIQTVATNAASVVTVAGSITGLNAIAANLAPILDASNQAAAAAISAGNALTYSLSASAYNDQANAYQLLAASYASNASTVFGQLQTLLASLADSGLSAAVLGAAKEIVSAADVVAAIIYDTALDSDGGAWRKRVKATSWFNEPLNTATRGKRTFFPKRALIVARAASVTIYDLDDSTCPMWMVFNAGGATNNWNFLLQTSQAVTGVSASNGFLYVGKVTDGLVVIDFIGDRARQIGNTGSGILTWGDGIASRNALPLRTAIPGTVGIVNANVNAVAATIFPGTPIDPVRKLPTPTVAVATAGGVSVIHWDGRVANSVYATAPVGVSFATDGTLWFSGGVANAAMVFSPSNEYVTTGFATRYYTGAPASGSPLFIGVAGTASVAQVKGGLARGTLQGLNILLPVPASGFAASSQFNSSSVAYITSTYSTGYQVGAIKMALAESTADITSLVGATLTDDFSTYADTAALQAVWVGQTGVVASLDTGRILLTNGAVGGAGERSFPTIIGAKYSISADLQGGTVNIDMAIGSASGGSDLGTVTAVAAGAGPTSRTTSFVAKTSTTFVRLRTGSTASGTSWADNIVMKRVASDRSVAGNNPIVVGTVTRAAVALNAELAAYGGFSAANYLELPAGAFSPGLGDWSFVVPFKRTGVSTNYQILMAYGTPGQAPGVSGQPYIELRIGNSGAGYRPEFFIYRSTSPFYQQLNGTTNLSDSQPHEIVAGRRGNNIEIWIDGKLEISAAVFDTASSQTNTTATIRIGSRQDATLGADATIIPLPRFGLGMPTPAQIRAMYAAEAPMFQPGAKCLLTGTDNVQGLSYDDGTNLLRAHKSANGTDVFSGLIRIGTENMASENLFGPEKVTNGDGSSITGWTASNCTLSIVGGKLRMTVIGTGNAFAYQTVTGLNASASHLAYAEYQGVSVANIATANRMTVYNGPGLTGILASTPNAINTAFGSGALRVTSGDTDVVVACAVISGTAGDIIDFDNISLKEFLTTRLASDNHKGGSASNDNIAIFTDADAYFKSPSISLREAMDTAIGRAATPAPYDRNTIQRPSCAVTTNATPTVIASFPMDKGEAGDWVIETVAREYGDPAAQEFALYRDHLLAFRPGEGNIALSGTSTQTILREVTASMAVAIQVNTTTQMIEVLATGVAAKNLEWGVKAIFFPVAQVA